MLKINYKYIISLFEITVVFNLNNICILSGKNINMADVNNQSTATQAAKKGFNWKICATAVFASVFYGFISFTAYKLNIKEEIPITIISCISGAVLGWIIGIITTPYDNDDKDKIGNFTKTIGAFLSGYVLSKFDKVLEEAFKPKILLTDLVGSRLLLALTCFGLTWIVVFVFRTYTRID